MHDKQDRCQYFVHALAITHFRIDSSVAEQYVSHCVLNRLFAKEFDARKRSHHILFDDRTQFLVTKMLIPNARLRLGQWIVFGRHPWIYVELFYQLHVSDKWKNWNFNSDLRRFETANKYRFRSHRRCVAHDWDRPVSTPSSRDQQTLRNFDTFRPPFSAKWRNCVNCASSDRLDKSFHSHLTNKTNRLNNNFFAFALNENSLVFFGRR